MKKTIIILLFIIILIFAGILFGIRLVDIEEKESVQKNNSIKQYKENELITTTEIASKEEKTSPNTLVIYKVYYTKCNHYIKKYENIDASKVNLTEEEFKEKCKGWKLESFSNKKIELSKEKEEFCDEHYRLKLENNEIIIYKIDEKGKEKEYKRTNITNEYLTNEDIMKLKNGIIIYGKENLMDSLEDYE